MAIKLLTTEEFAEMARTVPGTVRYWRHIGYGPRGVKRGRRVLYRADVVDAWLGGDDEAGAELAPAVEDQASDVPHLHVLPAAAQVRDEAQ